MTDVAKLSIQIDSSSAKTAAKDLQALGGVAGTLEGLIKKAAAAFAAWKITEHVKDVTLLAARYETLGVAMRVVGNAAGYTSAQMAQYDSAMQKAGISMIAAREGLTRMAASYLDLSKAGELAKAAQGLAVVGGIGSSEAFSRMVQGIRSGETEILKTLGLSVSFEKAYENMARAAGKTAKDLSEQEKAQARVNEVLAKSAPLMDVYGEAMGTAGKQLASMPRLLENLQILIGETFGGALSTVVTEMNKALENAKKWIDENKMAMDSMKDSITTATKAVVDLVSTLSKGIPIFGKVYEDITVIEVAMKDIAISVGIVTDAFKLLIGLNAVVWGSLAQAGNGVATFFAQFVMREKDLDRIYNKVRGITDTMLNFGGGILGNVFSKGGSTAQAYNGPDSAPDRSGDAAAKERERMRENAARREQERIDKLAGDRDQGAAKAAKKHGEEVARLVMALKDEAATLGMSETAQKLYELRKAGASQATIKFAESLLKQKEAFEAAKKGDEYLKGLQETLDKLGKTEAEVRLMDINKQGLDEGRKAQAVAIAEAIEVKKKDIEVEKELQAWIADGTKLLSERAAAEDKARQAEQKKIEDEVARLNQKGSYEGELGKLDELKAKGLDKDRYTEMFLDLQYKWGTTVGTMMRIGDELAGGLGDALGNMVMGVETKWDEMLKSMAASLAKFYAQQAVQKLLTWAFGAMVGGGADTPSVGVTNYSGGTTTNLPMGSFQSGQAAPMAAASAGVVNVPVVVNVNNGGGTGQAGQMDSAGGTRLGSAIQNAVRGVIIQEMRPGGVMYGRA